MDRILIGLYLWASILYY